MVETHGGVVMVQTNSALRCLPCQDSEERALTVRRMLNVSRDYARELGQSALKAVADGAYVAPSGRRIDWREKIERAKTLKQSIRPDDVLPSTLRETFTQTSVQVRNETTMQTAKSFVERGLHPLALNFANGISAGGGFLHGARAQEEVLCRSSALYATLEGDPMYEFHSQRDAPDSTDWMILSADVPFFRSDDGAALDQPWLLSVMSSAAPYAPRLGQPRSGDLLAQRIHRMLLVAAAYGYDVLVLGAWGCGAFGNDPVRTAKDFRTALEQHFCRHFSEVVFAIADWSPERRFLGPFRDEFSASNS
jgi:uncharacterized protein (TIGR02452 family)